MFVVKVLLADARLAGDHAVREGVVRGASVRLIPAGGELAAEAQGQRKFGLRRIASCAYSAPNSERQFISVGAGSYRKLLVVPCEKRLQAGEGRLAVLAQRDGFVRLELLDPCAEAELVRAVRPGSPGLRRCRRLRAMVRLLPLLLPARPICACGFEAALPPTTTAPTWCPVRKPGTLAAGVPGVGSPVKK